MKKLIPVVTAALVAGLVRAAAPVVSFKGDAITVTVPAGTVTDAASLVLCWGETDAGETDEGWDHKETLSDGGVTAAGGSWSVSASEKGISASDVMRAIIRGKMGYKVVEYVESNTGNVGGGGSPDNKSIGINTGIDAKTGIHVKTKMRWNELDDCDFCGGRNKSGDSTRFYAVHTYKDKWLLGYGDTTAYTVACQTGQVYEVESKLYLGSQTMFVDGVKVAEMTKNTTVSTLGPVAVLAGYYPANEPNPMTCASHARCYYLKLWENGNTTDNPEGDLVRDFIPVKDEFGHGALYDQVTKKVFESQFCGGTVEEFLSVGEETGDVVYPVNKGPFSCGAATVYDPAGTGGERPSGFVFALDPSVAGGQLSLAASFSCAGVGCYPLDAFVATLTVGEAAVNGTIDWIAGTITFPSAAVADDADAVFSLAYDTGAGDQFVSCLPVRLGTEDWFESTAAALNADGVWTGATAQDGRIALAAGAAYSPYSKAKAGLRVIDFTGVFGTVSGTDSTAPDNAKFGIEIREAGDDDYCFYVVANGNWLSVPSVEADPTAAYRVRVQLDGNAGTVAYYVTGRDGLTALCGPYANAASADGVSRICFDGAALLDSIVGVRRGLSEDYAFNAARRKNIVTINVDPDAVTEDDMTLVLCYDTKDRGADAAAWGSHFVVDPAVDPTGGTYTVNLSAAGIDSGRIRPFLVTYDFDPVELYESLSSKPKDAYNFGYVDTTVPAKYGTRVITKMSWANVTGSSDACYFGAREKSGTNTRLMPIHCYPGKWGQGYLTGNWDDPKTSAIVNDQVYEVEAKVYAGLQELTVDGVLKCSTTNEGTPDYSSICYDLFCCRYVDPLNVTNYRSVSSEATCYYLKIYTNGDKDTNPDGDLERDFVPAMKDGRCGLYDLKNREFVPGSETYLTCNNKTNELSCTIKDTLNHDPGAMPVRLGMALIFR